jgi:hypothetical protein
MTDIVERAKNVLIRVQKNQGATKEFADRDAVLAHVENEFVLASQEAPSVAKRRLEALANTIEVVKGVSWEGTTAVKIPVFEEKTTTKNDKTDKPGALSKERWRPFRERRSGRTQAGQEGQEGRRQARSR